VVVARAPGVGAGVGVRSRPSAMIGVDIGEPPLWVSLAGVTATGLPALARRPAGTLDVVVRDRSNRLLVSSSQGGPWAEWQPVELPAGATQVMSDPAAAASTDDGPDVVAVMPDGLLAHAVVLPPAPATWQSIPGSQGLRAPALAGGAGDLVLVALDPKGQLRLARRSSGGPWSGWTAVGALTGANAPAVTVTADGSVYVAAVTDDGTAWYTWGTPGSWALWEALGEPWALTRPALVSMPGIAVDVLARDPEGALLRRRISQLVATPWESVERRPPGPVSAVFTADGIELVSIDAAGTLLRRRLTGASDPDPQI